MRNISKRCNVNIIDSIENSYIEIVRKNGEVKRSLIDSGFSNEARKYHWQYTAAGYFRTAAIDGNILLHRMVYQFFNGQIPKGKQIDHVNGNPLDNRILNLRECSSIENARNTRNRNIITGGGITGVRKDLRCKNSWRAQIYLENEKHLEKTYQEKELAIIQRYIWELEYFDEFAPQIDKIRRDYPYLLNYNIVKNNMKFSDDIETVRRIGESLSSDKHCPCMLQKNDNTICPCLPCRTKNHCHCGMFEPRDVHST